MSNETLQTICNIGIAISVILGALFTYGTFHFGKLIEKENEAIAAESGKISSNQKSSPKEMILYLGNSKGCFVADSKTPDFYPLDFGNGTRILLNRINDEIVLTTDIYDSKGNLVATIRDNEWQVRKGSHWDRNYTKGIFEVLDNSGDVVLQLIAVEYGARIQAKMYGKDGVNHVVWGGPNNTGLIMMGLEKRQIDKVKFHRLFRYPSDRHLGELIQTDKRGK